MAEPEMERPEASPRVTTVFINNVDLYSSRCLAKHLCEPAVVQTQAAEEEENKLRSRNAARTFHLVGTVSGQSHVDIPPAVEQFVQPDREALLSKLMDCEVVIYNVTQHAEQVDEALWAVTALHKEMEHFSGPKMFILISTVMTWACSRPVDPEVPFTEEVFWGRRAHPNFKPHIDLEKKVVKMGKTKRTLFSTYVVASGLQYGMGEQIFHYFFKTSWQGQEQEIPVFGDGTNIVPTIHISDLASVIQNVIERQPKPYYFLAVDSSNNTLENIVKVLATVLGPGAIQKRPSEEAFHTQDMSTMEIDSLLVNLRLESVHLKELFSINWLCENGLVDNIQLVVDEYQKARGLLPIRLCVLGPPAVGKSSLSRRISDHYKLHLVNLKETISDTIAQLEDTVRDADPDVEDDSAAEAKELLASIKDSMEQSGGVLDDQLLVKVVGKKLRSNPCKNQGFVLDGFPKTYEQAKDLFSADDQESEEAEMPSYNKKIMPEFVLCLDASDDFLKERVMMLPERLVWEHNYEQEHFLHRLSRFRGNNVEDETVVNFFDEQGIAILHLEITSNAEPDCLVLMQKVVEEVGKPRNYGPPRHEVEEEERRVAEESIQRQAQENAEEERKEAEEAQQRAAHWEEWTKRLEEVRQEQEGVLETESGPMRNYLMEHVMPILTQGLMECCTARPEDPVDFLAEFLMKNNPFNY
ncbi:adenylate kinase 7 [Clinocottus analis]|uniref:adenylate kinase 7 n=1 Tax=Clinocottus analis TaxID=304258 RepID=UPI0035BEBD4D